MNQANILDLNDSTTWPTEIFTHAQSLARRLAGTAKYTSDLRPTDEDEAALGAMLTGHPVRVYHATRLLDHERDGISSNGLRPLTLNLVEERIAAACHYGFLTTAERDELRSAHVFAKNSARSRQGQICFFLPEDLLREDVSGVWRLLTRWGGEAIYSPLQDGTPLADLVHSVGRPTIVVAGVDLSECRAIFPSLAKLFIGRLLGLKDGWADVFYEFQVDSWDIVDIWQPGHPN